MFAYEHCRPIATPRGSPRPTAPDDFQGWALVAHFSHELRTPLNAALGFAELLESDPDLNLPQDRKAWLGHMTTACRHVVELVQGLLELSRLEQGVGTLACRPLDVEPIVAQALGLLQPAAQARRITLDCTVDTPFTQAHADPRALRQVLLNLIGNAVKYNREGGNVQVRIHASDAVHIDVHDTGCGLAPAQLAHAFEPFNRLGAEATEIEGSGLGLVITRRLAQAMGGSVGLSSQLGSGTCASLSLPLPPVAARAS